MLASINAYIICTNSDRIVVYERQPPVRGCAVDILFRAWCYSAYSPLLNIQSVSSVSFSSAYPAFPTSPHLTFSGETPICSSMWAVSSARRSYASAIFAINSLNTFSFCIFIRPLCLYLQGLFSLATP